MELVHLATLYHDDVMDEAEVRRGAKSANARWDNSIAILTGDFLFAHASRLVADLGPDAVRIIAETFAELVTGQTRETVGPGPTGSPIEHHLLVLDEKTASLIDTCARYAGMFSGATDAEIAALRRYGRAVGVAFQIADDIIDIVSADSGKTPGTDLREGVQTLSGAVHDRRRHRRPADRPGVPPADTTRPRWPRPSPCWPRRTACARPARRWTATPTEAAAALSDLPPSTARDALTSLTRFVVERTR